MKNFKSFAQKFIFSILFLSIFINQNAFATVYSHTISSATWSAYDTQNLTGIDWAATATGGAFWSYDATKGQQFGSGSNPATVLNLKTSDFVGVITSIKISTSGAASIAATLSVSVGGTTFTPSTVTLTATNTEYTFTGTGSGQVILNWIQTSSKALYLKKIEVTYSLSCSAPTTQAVLGSFSNIGLDNMTINWTKGNGTYSAVYINKVNSFTNPVDGTEASASTNYGGSGQQLVYIGGTGTSVTVTGLLPNTEYFAQVYTYNCSGTLTKYLTTIVDNYGSQSTTNYCNSATTQSSSIVATPTATSIALSWTKGNGDYRIVIAKKLTAVTAVPVNGTTYNASSNFGSGTQIATGEFVVYKGTGNSVTVTGLLEITKYYFVIYEFCAPTGAGSESYLTSPVAPTK